MKLELGFDNMYFNVECWNYKLSKIRDWRNR